jgi:signal transduction histidine kinase
MLSSVFQLPHHLQDQGVWLSIAASYGDVPPAFWALQGLCIAAAGMAGGIGYLLRQWFVRERHGHAVQGGQGIQTGQAAQAVQAVQAERRRIASDLHDGVGSRLVALLASNDPRSAAPSELSMALQACLLELQMTVDSLDDQASASIAERLAHLRYRLQPAFDRLGIGLAWNVRDVPLAHAMPAESALQICRIAQEALSNVLRHSHAGSVEVRFGPLGRSRGLLLEVRDDGRGLGAPARMPIERLGKGLRSMRARADALHGDLAVMDAVPHGLCVRLVLGHEALAPVLRDPLPAAASSL